MTKQTNKLDSVKLDPNKFKLIRRKNTLIFMDKETIINMVKLNYFDRLMWRLGFREYVRKKKIQKWMKFWSMPRV